MEIAEALDPEGRMIQGRLGRESTITKGTKYIKDFSYLGRPIKDVIYIDFSEDCVLPIHQANTIILPEWTGDSDDRELIDLVPFLESKCAVNCRHRAEARRRERRASEVRPEGHRSEVQLGAVPAPRDHHEAARLRPPWQNDPDESGQQADK